MHFPAPNRPLTLALSGAGAVLCFLWMLGHTVQVEERAAGLRLTFSSPQATSLRAQWDTGKGYDSSPPILIMIPRGSAQVATIPRPQETTRSLRISLPTPDASTLTLAKWFFKSPDHEVDIPLDNFVDVHLRDPREIPLTRFLLEDTPVSRTRLHWEWSWQFLVGAVGTALMVTLWAWAFIRAPGILSRIKRLAPHWHRLRGVGRRWIGPAAAATSLSAAIAGFLALLRTTPFCDEGDNLLGGTILAQGGAMYRDFYSQHPPFVYHLMSLFAALGIHSTEGFRVGWMLFLTALWIAIYFIYRKDFGSEFLCIIVLGYTFSSSAYMPTLVLSDGSHAFGLLIVWLECLRFQGLATMPRWRILWLGCALFMTTMSAAVSLYALFPLGLAFAWKEARAESQETLRDRLRRGSLAVAIAATPFGVFALCYAANGNLGAFYRQAYVFNRTVYPKYLQDYGGNPWTHYLRPPQALFHYLDRELERLIEGVLTWQESTSLSVACVALIAVVATHRRAPVLGVCMLAFLIMSGDRGYTPYFHTQPFLVISLGALGIWALRPLIASPARSWVAAMLCCVALVALRQTAGNAGKTLKQSIETGSATPYDDWILRHTASSDTVWESELTPQLYINTGRRPASRVTDLVPWFYQAYKDELLQDLATNQPKIIIMDPMRNVWGHLASAYAPELMRYINDHYAKPPAEAHAPRHLWMLKPPSTQRSEAAPQGGAEPQASLGAARPKSL